MNYPGAMTKVTSFAELSMISQASSYFTVYNIDFNSSLLYVKIYIFFYIKRFLRAPGEVSTSKSRNQSSLTNPTMDTRARNEQRENGH